MKVTVQQEDLQLLAQILQACLGAEVASGELFQVKCAVKNDQLMILTQHPLSVTTDTEKLFVVLEQALQSLPPPREQRVQFFLRVDGEKLPYAKRTTDLKARGTGGQGRRVWATGVLRYILPLSPSPLIPTPWGHPLPHPPLLF
ncbi:MAG: hypothetical protein ACHBN1_17150 [Heteroscytonema crispum UTEX LB 1556]